jgi:hypothetical protein
MRQQAKYNCSCGDNSEANVCCCSTCHNILRNDNSPCNYFGRCVEPLAWSIEHEPIRNQTQCPLYSILPREIRDLIFEYALTDCNAHSLQSLLQRNAHRSMPRLSKPSTNDIANDLLRTCRSIYLETWTLPLSLNPYIVYDLQSPGRLGVKLHELLPWQLALIQRLDLTLQQTALEGDTFRQYLLRSSTWNPLGRHEGVYVAPRRYKSNDRSLLMNAFPISFNFALLPATDHQDRHFISHIFGENLQRIPEASHPPWSSAMRVARARPLVQLTLRLLHSDWWTWTDPPDSADELHHLGLDPTMGDGTASELIRPTATRMRALAERRRNGQPPDVVLGKGWAATIGQLPDLKRLELVFETFAGKKKQLDNVVAAAIAWIFPTADTRFELAWNGELEESSWSMHKAGAEEAAQSQTPVLPAPHQRRGEPSWHDDCNEFEVRIMRFTRRRAC